MTRSIWFKCFSGARAPAAAVLEELARLEVVAHPDKSKAQEDDCCIAAVSQVDPTVIAEVEKPRSRPMSWCCQLRKRQY